MQWLQFLFKISLLITVGADLIVLAHVFPAFRRTKNKAFLYISIACVFGIIDTVCDHLDVLQALQGDAYVIYRTLRRFGFFADIIFWTIGIVMIARPFLADSQPTKPEDDPRA